MELTSIFIKSSAVLSVFLLVYYLLLQKSSHFNINRAFLFIGLLATITISLVNVTYPVYVDMQMPAYAEAPMLSVEEVPVVSPEEIVVIEKTIDWNSILLWAYSCISAIFIFRLLLSVVYGIRLVYSAQKVKWGSTFLYMHPSVKNPMVFGNRIFVKDDSYLNVEKVQVLIHEQVHQEQKHWVDMLMIELLLAFAWFNPLTFIYRKAVINNLEYIADRGVLNSGLQLNTYIQSILCETMGTESLVLANHFRTSQNKQRLKMMKNVKQSKWGKFKLLLILPIIGGLCWAFSEPEYIAKDDAEFHKSNIERTELVKGKVYVADTMEVRQADGTYETHIVWNDYEDFNVVIKGTNLGTFTDKKGEFELKAKKGDVLVFSHVGHVTIEIEYTGQESIKLIPNRANPRKLSPGKYRDKYFGKTNSKIVFKEVKTGSMSGKSGEVFMAVEELPKYKYGMETFFAQLYSKSAQVAKERGYKGATDVIFNIDKEGNINKVQVSGNSEADQKEAAAKIVKELNNWIPAKQRGKAVPFTYVVKVEF